MKNINKYLSTKVNKIDKYFPEILNKENIINFLISKGFTGKEYNAEFFKYTDMMHDYMTSEFPVFYIGQFIENEPDSHWIRFGKGKNDPLFFCRLKHGILKMDFFMAKVTKYPNGKIYEDALRDFKNYNEFRDYVQRYYNW